MSKKFTVSTKESNEWRKAFKFDENNVLNLLSDFLGIKECEGMAKQDNRGKTSEMMLQYSLGLHPNFDGINKYDFIYQGLRVQFKYLGQNSAPSVGESKRLKGESILKFANRLMKEYKEADIFALSFENFISNINWDNTIKVSREQFKNIIKGHDKNLKEGNKLRLRKTVVKRVLGI